MTDKQIMNEIDTKLNEKRLAALKTLVTIDPATECWVWKFTPDGNGVLRFLDIIGPGKATRRPALVIAWEVTRGETVRLQDIVLTCQNPLCVNPEHLSSSKNNTHRQRFLQKVKKPLNPKNCWIWEGMRYRDAGHYIGHDLVRRPAHVWAWVLWKEEEPDLVHYRISHTCNDSYCVNPAHMQLVLKEVTPAPANLFKAKEVCAHGHPFTHENTYVIGGVRQCKICVRLRSGESIKRKAEERCKVGHIRTEENTRISPKGSKICLVCENIALEAKPLSKRTMRTYECSHGHPWTEGMYDMTPNGKRSCNVCRGTAVCPQGHPLTEKNLFVTGTPGMKGRTLLCLTCHPSAS